MIRFILLSILLTILLRAAMRLWAGIVRGVQEGQADGGRVPQRGVQMQRDPVCGTFVVPERAIALSTEDNSRIYFCSADCRDKYRAGRHSTPSASAHGRTA
jgi:YHS domain-containing protein